MSGDRCRYSPPAGRSRWCPKDRCLHNAHDCAEQQPYSNNHAVGMNAVSAQVFLFSTQQVTPATHHSMMTLSAPEKWKVKGKTGIEDVRLERRYANGALVYERATGKPNLDRDCTGHALQSNRQFLPTLVSRGFRLFSRPSEKELDRRPRGTRFHRRFESISGCALPRRRHHCRFHPRFP